MLKIDNLLENDQRILIVLNDGEPRSRSYICERTNLARTTAYDALQRLIRLGLVETWRVKKVGRGRPKILFCKVLNPEAI